MSKSERVLHSMLILACLALVLFGFIDIARADRVDDVQDALSKGNRTPYCEAWTRFAVWGAKGRAHDRPLVLKHITQVEIAALELPDETLPPDAMYIITDGMTEQEIRFIEDAGFAGWQWGDRQEQGRLKAMSGSEAAAALRKICMASDESRAGGADRFVIAPPTTGDAICRT